MIMVSLPNVVNFLPDELTREALAEVNADDNSNDNGPPRGRFMAKIPIPGRHCSARFLLLQTM